MLTIWSLQTRIQVENASFISYLIFHHSLRIRIKSNVFDEKAEEKDKKDSSGSTSTHASSTPDATDVESVHEDVSELISDESGASPSEPVPEGGHVNEKTGAMVGKINNLVTTDLSIVGLAYRAVDLRGLCVRAFCHIS